jgi:lysophospholipase L1-like esterase
MALLILVLGFREFRSTLLARPAPPGAIVFTGASSVAYWDSLPKDMKPLPIINTAFGGAQYSDVIARVDKLVIAYRPSAVVIYAGDNDLATPTRKTPQSVTSDVRQFVEIVHSKLPDTWIYVLSVKPSYARWDAWPKMKEADGLIQDYLRTQDHTQFIDVASPMFDAQGNLPRELFVSDGLHPSAKCYALWTSIIKPILLERFGPSKLGS